jgi:hypothetical protein
MSTKNALRMRGLFKLFAMIMIGDHFMSLIFAYACHAVDPSVPDNVVTGFGLVSSLMLGFWIQSDAKRAFEFAATNKLVAGLNPSNPLPRIKPECPKKWLVLLHIELNPAAVGL